jgi:predicted ATPase
LLCNLEGFDFMLTRLKVSGFKNLVDVDVSFGPFTCIAGANGVGKSNLLDAIAFLSSLTDQSLVEAALNVRDEKGRAGDVTSIFHRVGKTHDPTMLFEADMIIPRDGVDDLGQRAEASITFLRYKLELGYRKEEVRGAWGPIELLHEELEHIKIGDAKEHLSFPHSGSWRQSAVTGRRTSPFVSTETDENGNKVVKIHQDGRSGIARRLLASTLPRTAVSRTDAENPTALLARREMQSWRRLQLEPSALREPDSFTAPTKMGVDGAHLAAALYDLAKGTWVLKQGSLPEGVEQSVYTQLANRLTELIDDVLAVKVDRDEKRELLTLQVTGRDGTAYPARDLSDGTLRFLALAVIELDASSSGLLCLEEPENGIHPARIPAMLSLLLDIATDVKDAIGSDNPLRQVIINTHSPSVVAQVPDDTLLLAENRESRSHGQKFKKLTFSCLPATWRSASTKMDSISRGKLLAYLSPAAVEDNPLSLNGPPGSTRVIDRKDLQMPLEF